jgi:hypothetical protein
MIASVGVTVIAPTSAVVDDQEEKSPDSNPSEKIKSLDGTGLGVDVWVGVAVGNFPAARELNRKSPLPVLYVLFLSIKSSRFWVNLENIPEFVSLFGFTGSPTLRPIGPVIEDNIKLKTTKRFRPDDNKLNMQTSLKKNRNYDRGLPFRCLINVCIYYCEFENKSQ